MGKRKAVHECVAGRLTSDFWMTGFSIVRYIPRAFRVKQIDGNLFYTEEKRQEYRRRVESVTPNSQRQWGTMNVDQMLHHLNLACEDRWASTIFPTKVT